METKKLVEKERLAKYHKLYREELFESVIPFWETYAFDKEYGGIATSVDEKGVRYSGDKSIWMQGRTAWVFSRLCNTYGPRDSWLAEAKSCIDFMDSHCIDPADGKLYFTVTQDGRPLRKRRYVYSEAFYVLGNAEYYRASGDAVCLEKARKYYDRIFKILVEGKQECYILEPKFYEETRPIRSFASYMIMLDVTSTMKKSDLERLDYYNACVHRCVEEIFRSFVREDLNGVLEHVAADGTFMSEIPFGRIMNPGHGLEGSWFLTNELETMNDPTMLARIENIYTMCMERGWDKEYGGITYLVDILDHPLEQYEHDMKHWWGACEVLIAAMTLYVKTRNEKYFDDFEMITQHSFKYFADHRYGEWYGYLRRDCRPTEPICKGHIYKGPYHVPRMLIYVERMLDALIKEYE